jgi:UDP-glucose:(heptosyl)LPS alpha-1,3-glucosyltransferase
MRLGIVRQRYTPFGGAERFVERAIDALVARGVHVRIYTRRWPAAADPRIEPVICDPFYAGSLWRDASFAAAVTRRSPATGRTSCSRTRAHRGLRHLPRRRRRASRVDRRAHRHRRPPGALAHRGEPVPPLQARAESGCSRIRRCAVICISKMVKEDVLRHFTARRAAHVIYNAVDPREFGPQVRADRPAARARRGLAERDVAFLLVGSDYARKGVATAIRALARLPETARLVVVGRDKSPERFARIARREGVAGRVEFAGPQQDPRPFLGAADAFVLPTLYDPLSNAVLEALACALPVVTSRRCGAGELVVAHDAGWTCDSTDVARSPSG